MKLKEILQIVIAGLLLGVLTIIGILILTSEPEKAEPHDYLIIWKDAPADINAVTYVNDDVFKIIKLEKDLEIDKFSCLPVDSTDTAEEANLRIYDINDYDINGLWHDVNPWLQDK